MAELATIARPYAEALFHSAQPSDLASWAEQLSELAQVASYSEVVSLANNPNLPTEKLVEILLGALKTKVAKPVENFVTILAQNHRLAAMSEISSQFEALKNAHDGAAEVVITSAFPMGNEELSGLLETLKKRFGGKKLIPSVAVDPELIGGVRVQVGDEVLDTSVKARLVAMQAALSA